MKIEEVIFHDVTNVAFGLRRSATIVMTDGAHLNAWYDPQSYRLLHAKRRFTSKRLYVKRNLESAAGRKLADEFKIYAQKHEPQQIKAMNDAKAEAKRQRLVEVAERQCAHAAAAAAEVMKAMGMSACPAAKTINYKTAAVIVSALIEAGFIDRNPH